MPKNVETVAQRCNQVRPKSVHVLQAKQSPTLHQAQCQQSSYCGNGPLSMGCRFLKHSACKIHIGAMDPPPCSVDSSGRVQPKIRLGLWTPLRPCGVVSSGTVQAKIRLGPWTAAWGVSIVLSVRAASLHQAQCRQRSDWTYGLLRGASLLSTP